MGNYDDVIIIVPLRNEQWNKCVEKDFFSDRLPQRCLFNILRFFLMVGVCYYVHHSIMSCNDQLVCYLFCLSSRIHIL